MPLLRVCRGPVKEMAQFIDSHTGSKVAQCSNQGGAVTAFG